MPISFEQPEPFSASASAGYGAAQSSDRMLPVLAGLQEAAARNYLARQHMEQQFAESGADRQMAMNQFSARLNQQAGDAGADRTLQGEMGRAQMQNRLDLQQQGAQLDEWQRSQALTQAESLRLQRMKAGVAEIDRTPDLSDEEKTVAKLKLRTGIDLYEERKQASIAKQHEMQTQALQQQHAILSQLNSTDQAMSAQAFNQRVKNHPLLGPGYIKVNGDFEPVQVKAKEPLDFLKAVPHALEFAQAEADAAHPPVMEDGKERRTQENRAYRFKVLERERNAYVEAHKTPEQRAAEAHAAAVAEASPANKARKIASADAAMSAWSERTDVDDKTKQAALVALQQMKLMHTSPGPMSPKVRAMYDQLDAFLATLPKPPGVALAPSGNRTADVNATGTTDNRLPDLGVTGSDFGSAGMN